MTRKRLDELAVDEVGDFGKILLHGVDKLAKDQKFANARRVRSAGSDRFAVDKIRIALELKNVLSLIIQ
jgi:hypothetical protein